MRGQYTGLKNRRVPRYGRPAVVVAVLDTPVRDSERESGSTYFREPLDWVLELIWDEDPNRGEFVTFHYDTRRVRPRSPFRPRGLVGWTSVAQSTLRRER